MKWVKLKKYCELSGDTEDAVHAKVRRGIWVKGVQIKAAGDNALWVNTEEVDKWVEKGTQAIQEAISRAG
jgi:hypothetical protein